jgi:hypothetical protein
MTDEGLPILVWDTCEIVDSAVRYQLEQCAPAPQSEAEIRKSVCCDTDLFRYEWDALCEELTRVMSERKTTRWRAEVHNFGWRKQNGVQELEAATGQELLEKVLPRTDNTFKVFMVGEEIHINNAHHDAPTWEEWYFIAPVHPKVSDEEHAAACEAT